MRTPTTLAIMIGAISLSVLAIPATAQQDAKRDAAIRKCVTQIQSIMGTAEEDMNRRIAAWKACMAAQGERP